MNTEIRFLVEQMRDAYEGDPWFGRNVKSLLQEVNLAIAMEKPGGQHSLLELVWHMVTWREFVISRLQPDASRDLKYFETHDWRQLDHADNSLWYQGVQRLQQTQEQLVEILEGRNDALLDQQVEERSYNFRKLLNGIVQHDIYHIGQVAYLVKWLKNKKA